MKIRQLFALVAISLTLTACAGGPKIKMKDDVRTSFKSVAINPEVKLPQSIYVTSATSNVANNFGLLGMMVGDSDIKNKKKELTLAIEKQKFDLSKVVYKQVAREMAKHTPYKPLKVNDAADTTMSIEVHLYGVQSVAASPRMYPQVTVSAEIKNAKGKAIWRNSATAGPLQKKNEAKYTYEQLIAQPARLQEVLTRASALATKSLMADL